MDAAPYDDHTLRRTMARLVGLADLAERAAGRCFAVRFLVLLVLRRAEAVARDFVADAMGMDGLWFDDGLGRRSRPEDAVLIALRFRTLADELAALLSRTGSQQDLLHGTSLGSVAAWPCGQTARFALRLPGMARLRWPGAEPRASAMAGTPSAPRRTRPGRADVPALDGAAAPPLHDTS